MIDNNKIVSVLYGIPDPKSGSNIIDTDRVRNLKVKDNTVYFELVVSNLDSAVRAELNFACQAGIKEIYPEADIHIHMKVDKEEGRTIKAIPHIHSIVAIASGKGGVGKSTMAANLARGLKAMGLRVGILDADLYGPSMPIMFGMEGQRPEIQKIMGSPKIVPLLTDEGIHMISIGFVVEPEQAVVLRGPRLSGVIKQFVNETVWPELDVLIVDLPPGTGDIQLTLVQTVPVTGALLVTTPQNVAYADALKAANMFRLDNINVPILGVIENMSWFTPSDLPDRQYRIFGQGGGEKLAMSIGTKVLGQVPLVMEIRESGDHAMKVDQAWIGEDGYFGIMARKLMESIKSRNENFKPTEIVQIKN
jgi:ATP-binding protein involved in chromosome partitioning